MNTFRITDGTTTVNFLGGSPITGATYVPATPSPEVTRFASALINGDTINAISRHNVVEPVSLIMEGTSSAMETMRTSIQRLLWLAEQRQQSGSGAVVYVEYEETSASDTYRSELIGGTVEYADAISRRTRHDTESTVELIIQWERAWFWESTTETQVSTRVKNGTAGVYSASAKTIYNREDFSGSPTYANWLEIAAGGIGGDIPAPARIWLRNTSGADRAISEYLFFNSWQMPLYTSGKLFVDMESFDSATAISDATCSGGYKSRISATPSGATTSFPISALPSSANRLYFVPIMRCAAFTENVVWVKMMMISYLFGYADLGVETEEKLLSGVGDLQVFDAIPIPVQGNISAAFILRSESVTTVDGDWVYFAPVDSVRRVRSVGLDVVSTGKMVDYGNGLTEMLDGSDVNYGFATPVGPPLMLMPGAAQRVSFLASGDGSRPTWSFEFALYYRKRVLTP